MFTSGFDSFNILRSA